MRIKIYATPSQSIPSPMTANTNLPWLGGVGAQGVYRQWRYEKKYRFSYHPATCRCNQSQGDAGSLRSASKVAIDNRRTDP